MGELAKVILSRNDLNGANIKQCCFRTECSKQPGGRCNIFMEMMRYHNMLTQPPPPKHLGDKRKRNDPTDEQLAQREVEKDAIKAKRREAQRVPRTRQGPLHQRRQVHCPAHDRPGGDHVQRHGRVGRESESQQQNLRMVPPRRERSDHLLLNSLKRDSKLQS